MWISWERKVKTKGAITAKALKQGHEQIFPEKQYVANSQCIMSEGGELGGRWRSKIIVTKYKFDFISKYITNTGKTYAMNTISQLTAVHRSNQNIVRYKTNNKKL